MFRRLRRAMNRILHRSGFAPLFLLAACSQCNLPPPPPEEPPTTTGTTGGSDPSLPGQCAEVCNFYRSGNCAQAVDVCAADGFDENGECVRMVSCVEACQESPDYYLAGECE